MAYAPERLDGLLTAARAGASWRAELGLPEPSPRLADGIESLGRMTELVAAPPGTSLFDALLTAAGEDRPDEGTLDGLVRQALLSMLEERRTREPNSSGSHPLTRGRRQPRARQRAQCNGGQAQKIGTASLCGPRVCS